MTGRVPDSGKLRIFFDRGLNKPPVFRITPALYRAARRRHPAAARHLSATFGPTMDALAGSIGRVDAVVGFRFPAELIRSRGRHLRLLHATGAGVDHLLPLDWLPPGTALTNNSGVHAAKATESAMLAILALNGALPRLIDQQRARHWNQVFTPVVAGKTLLVIGMGGMGLAAARAGRNLGMHVIGLRRSARPHRAVAEMHGPADLARVIGRADVVLNTAPLTPATRHLIGRRALGRMKPTAGLINMGRGGVVDYDALVSKLEEGRIAGAVLDVFEEEPLPPDSPLWRAPNLIITPHVAADDPASYGRLTLDLVFENATRLIAGRRLRNRVQPARGY